MRYKIFRFAVLVPHRDIRPALRSFRSRLFAAGIWGVYTFPPVVPLALLERPLGESELKALASSLRALSLEAGSGVFTAAGSPVLITGPREGGLFGLSFWGLPLNIPVPSLPDMTGALPFPQAALCAAVAGTRPGTEREILRTQDIFPEKPPALRFRAAAAANLTIKFLPDKGGGTSEAGTLPGLSSRWRIGKPCWLKRN